ncbi:MULTISPECIES: hypothetical protein [Flavobacteriaceae]|uniref:hypothetical protein n=1 Tax=Flavobacteriaceae TaxID=49546 RepID=UPI0010AE605C|nr:MULTISPECIES: hypothetical protein [Flavobacteriaceae]NJB37864.1 hypothetical protein [Croceivirga sp. JEA036]TKD60484.1 hypothetical protein FBT53_12825 [Flavobacterium sp. ASW18X]
MKKLRLLIATALLTSMVGVAQRGPEHKGKDLKAELSVEQLATLRTKRLTLALDLDSKQQKQVMDLNLEQVAKHKQKMDERKAKREEGERERPSPEERFKLENEKLDARIAHQNAMKDILSDEQYELWKQMHKNRKGKDGDDRMRMHKKEDRRG